MKPKFKKGDKVKFIEEISVDCETCGQYTHYDEKKRIGIIKSWKAEAVIRIDDLVASSTEEVQPDGTTIEKPYISDIKVQEYGVPNAIFYDIDVKGEIFNEDEDSLTLVK